MSPTIVPVMHRAWRDAAIRERPALIGEAGELTYGELFDRVGLLSGSLRAAGIGHGERVGIAMNRSIDLVVTLLSVLASGACACVLEPRLGAAETRRRFAMTRLGWLIADADHRSDPSFVDLPEVVRIAPEQLASATTSWALDCEPGAAA
jgi:acyl-coenzyme A synthetase/AMP-(fatty) acid ligase